MAIALIEDDPIQRRVLRAILEHTNRDIIEFADGVTAWEHIQNDPSIQLVVTDWMMPGLDGPALIRKIREAALPYYIYILLLTARHDRTDIVAGLQGGADDYLTKPIDAREFVARIVVGERILRLEQQLRASHDEQRYLANHDLLTGAFNRRAFYERFGGLVNQQVGGPLSALMIDIDHFKAINDRFGHHIGDQALQQVVQAIRACIRASDWLARWGGEEFLVLLPSTDHGQALRIAERIRLALAQGPMVVSETVAVPIQVSIGVTSSDQVAPSGLDALLREADSALYTAKDSGRNRVWSAITGASSLSEQEAFAPFEQQERATALAEKGLLTNQPFAHWNPLSGFAPSSIDNAELPTFAAPARDHGEGAADPQALAQLKHDVRGRFSGVIGMTELLLETELTAEQREFAASILSGSVDLLGILDTMFNRTDNRAEKSEADDSSGTSSLLAREFIDE
jgi:diguanylate cyclase (GGDEF)-like protein